MYMAENLRGANRLKKNSVVLNIFLKISFSTSQFFKKKIRKKKFTT